MEGACMNKEIKDNKILLCITGGSPQVVTETLYCLITQDKPYIPTHIIIVSTTKGINDARRQLEAIDSEEDKYEGKSIMEEFCKVMHDELQGKKYSEKNGNIEYHTLKRKDGSELNDILSTADSEATANYIVELIKRLCSIEDNANIKHTLHVSIAGGRKTMSFYAGYALSLFGRNNDKLSHVLIESDGGTTPSTFEKIQTFYFPKQIRPLKKDPKTKDVIKEIHANDAKLALTEIPIVKLHSQLPREFIKNDGNNTSPNYEEIVKRFQRAMDKDSYELSFDIKKNIVEINGDKIKLRAQILATYLASIKYFYEIKNPNYSKIKQLNEGDDRNQINYFEFDGPFFKIFLRIWNFIEKISRKDNSCLDQKIDYNDLEFFEALKNLIEIEALKNQNKSCNKNEQDKLKQIMPQLKKNVPKKLELKNEKEYTPQGNFNALVYKFENSTSDENAIFLKTDEANKIIGPLRSNIKGILGEVLNKKETEYFLLKKLPNTQSFCYEINPKQIKAESTMGILDPEFYK